MSVPTHSGGDAPRQAPTMGISPTVALVYRDVAIANDGDMLNLTDMWRAAGSDASRRPTDWLRSAEAKRFMEFLTQMLDVGNSHLDLVQRDRGGKGGSGQTMAHWQVGLAYAKYLSPEFHAWCNTVVRQRMEGPPPAPVLDLNDPAALRHLLVSYTETTLRLQHEVHAMADDVAALDRIAKADGSLCMTDAAKTLGLRPGDLIGWMARSGWIYKRPGTSHWVGYQSKLISGDLEHKVTTVLRADGSEKTTEQVRVTAKGLVRLAKLHPGAVKEVGR